MQSELFHKGIDMHIRLETPCVCCSLFPGCHRKTYPHMPPELNLFIFRGSPTASAPVPLIYTAQRSSIWHSGLLINLL